MRPPEYLIRSMKANPDHAVVVYNFMKAASQFYKARWRLAHVAKKNNEIDLYFFKGTIGRPPKLQRRGGLSHSYQEPHTPEPDRILYISPALLHKQSEPLSEDLLSNGLDNRFERSTLGDLGQNWSNRSQPSTDTMNNIVDSNSLDTSSSSMCEIAAISLPKSSETTNCSTPDTNKIATQANMQASVENVSDEGDDIIPQGEQARSTADGESIQVDVDDVSGEGDNIISQKRARPTGDSENMQGRVEDVNVEGDDIVPQNKQARLTGKGDPLQRAGPRKKPSLKQGKKAKLAPSSVQKKSMDLAVQKTSPQQASSPPSMTRYHAYDQMRCLFGPDKENPEKEKTLSESDIAEILALYAKSSRPDLATFLENLSNLWRSNRFWSPDALHLSMPEELSLRSSCLRLFRYDWDLGKESGINVIRRRFVQLKLHLSFIRLCNEMTNPQSACFKTRLNSRRIASHAIDNLMKLDGSNGYSDDPLAPKDRGRFAKTNAKGRRWYLISHYIGWGSLIIFSNIDTTLAKVNLIGLEGFITYVLNTQPRVVALCHRYEQPVKDLLNGRKPALTLTEQEVKSTIGDLPHAIDHNEDAKNHWQRINTMIDTDVSEVLSHD